MLKLLRKKKKGFTLTETIVVIGLLAIIIACVVAFSSPVRAMIRNTSAKGDALSINKIMGDYLERRLAYASSIHAFTEVNFDNIMTGHDTPILTANYAAALAAPGTPGMIVIKYEPNAADPKKSTYKLYDVKMTGTTDITDSIQNLGVVEIKNAVYADAFYCDYEYFIGMNPKVEVNSLKNKAYISFEIDAFNFTDDYGYTLDANTMAKFYNPVAVPGHATLKDKGVNLMQEEKIGTENVSFALENVTSTVTYEDDGTGTYVVKENVNGCTVSNVRLLSTADPTYVPQVGNDIVIFYNIVTY